MSRLYRIATHAAVTWCLAVSGAAVLAAPPATKPAPPPAGISADDRQQVERDLKALYAALAPFRGATDPRKLDLFADADCFAKSVTWALRFDAEKLSPADVALIKTSLLRGRERAAELAAGRSPWEGRAGKVLRGYGSAIDGSTQTFGLIVPRGYDPAKPIRLDVVLHGSSKPVGASELRFGARFDEGDAAAAKTGPEAEFIELHPLGRVENCYRFGGETDVFEAIEAVCRNYNIDRNRIVLRGMSMGASGTWHLGLKHPGYFAALGPYCGYVDTHRFSQTPNFTRVDALPPHQEMGLHMLDSVDYAANAGVVPVVAAIGEKDPFFDYAHVLMEAAMAKEGLKLVNLISPGTGHTIDPVTHREQMRRIAEHVAKGRDAAPRQLRFVTWTLKYARCHWVEVLGLGRHYERAEIRARATDDGAVDVEQPVNVTAFAIGPPMLQAAGSRLRVGGVDVTLPAPGDGARTLAFARDGAGWKCFGARATYAPAGKRPEVQGPIDDAFTSPFLAVRGTGKAWNGVVGAWADASLRRFGYEYARYFRADLPVKNDVDVTEEDLRTKNLILFGDPGSNVLIGKALQHLPFTWTRDELGVGPGRYPARDHAPAMVYPSPFAAHRYVVINSGHTFHEKELAAYNYLLFPRLGDWAVVRVAGGAEGWQPGAAFPENAVEAGYFDEQWKFAVGGK